jgi:hypothetical protein
MARTPKKPIPGYHASDEKKKMNLYIKRALIDEMLSRGWIARGGRSGYKYLARTINTCIEACLYDSKANREACMLMGIPHEMRTIDMERMKKEYLESRPDE